MTAARSGGPTPPAPRERPVPAIDGFEILGELGRGGIGVVYRARQILLNRRCVLRVILSGAHADALAALRFLAEAEAAARLRHPNIVQIHHVGEADGLPYFELEYVEGGSLDRRLDGTPWPARRSEIAVTRYRTTAPRLAEWLAANVPPGPAAHRRRPRTIDMLERLNEQLKRRPRVAGLTPDEASAPRPVSAVAMEIGAEWETNRK